MTPLLELRGVTKHFGGLPAVDGIDLEVAAAEIVAVIGPNGAGKSTLLHLINGLLPATTAQRIALDGVDLAGRRPHHIRRAGIATVLQSPRVFASMTVLDNVVVGARFARGTGAARRAAADPISTTPEHAAMVALERFGLADRARVGVDELTLHDQRLLELARALAGAPRLVLLDEVMAGLNPTEIDRLVEVVGGLRDDLGITIVWVEHVMRAVTGLADRVVVLEAGRVLADGTADAVLRDRRVIDAYLGRDAGHAAG